MKFSTKWERPVPKPEENLGESLVESAGYISAQQQIENMMLAGETLNKYRLENYDFTAQMEDDDSYIDPTRSPNFDMADASALDRQLAEGRNLTKKQLEAETNRLIAEQKAAENAAQKSNEPSST